MVPNVFRSWSQYGEYENDMILWDHCSLILKVGVYCCEILFETGSKFFTNWTGFPAQRVFSGILLPGGTVELGAMTQPLSSCEPSMMTDLKPMCTWSSMMEDLTLTECSMLTLLPMLSERGKASSGAQWTVSKTVLSPILVFYPTLMA